MTTTSSTARGQWFASAGRALVWGGAGHLLVPVPGLVLVAVAIASCTGRNAAYCDAAIPCTDPARPFCDEAGAFRASDGVSYTCIPAPRCSGLCGTEAPVCAPENETCASCRQDADCARFSDSRFCAADGTCVGCEKNADCGSGACDPVTSQCASEADVIYVDSSSDPGAGDCTRRSPCNDLQVALGLVSPSRFIIRMADGNYGGPVRVGAQTLAILADGGALMALASGAPIDSETVIVEAGGVLFLQGVHVRGSSVVEDVAAIRCEDYTMADTRLRLLGVRVSGASGPALDSQNCDVEIRGSTFAQNGDVGILTGQGRLDVTRSVIQENRGGGVFASGTLLDFRNNFVTRNGSVTGGLGGAFLYDPAAGSSFEHNTVVGNLSWGETAGVTCGGSLVLTNNIIYDNSVSEQVSGCTHRYSIIGPVAAEGTGNLDVEPIFVAANSIDDLHLDPASPGIDQGEDSAVHDDIDGEVRPQGESPDIGADEVRPR